MDVVELTPRLHAILFPAGHVYLWSDPGGLTLIDAGLPGSAPLIAEAIRQAGHQPADVRRLVLTHFHQDHIGAPAAAAAWGDVEGMGHSRGVPVRRAGAAGPPPVRAVWEKPVPAQVTSQPPAQPVVPPRIDRELTDGDE